MLSKWVPWLSLKEIQTMDSPLRFYLVALFIYQQNNLAN
ncbi:hypothetical protein [Phage Phass-1]|uniref:Uncharacterized protein n=1 Tax=Phage Phass-1 TaxID=3043662 RepID=A0AAF0RXC9_9CAUD|nr:hypothetical protein [Phage Phass-1]